MPNLLSSADLSLLLRLIIAHLIADFLLQRAHWVEERYRRKWTSVWLYVHGALAGVLAYAFSGLWSVFWLPLALFVSHIILDGCKSSRKDTTRSFLLDQLGHLAVILIVWVLAADVNTSDMLNFLAPLGSNVAFWTLLLSYILVFWPAGVLIGKFTEPWRAKTNGEPSRGLERAGLWIGRLERILVLTAVLLNRFELIGFLIAAKSILRFGDIRARGSREQAEYILIGTMLSFAIAIALGIFASWILHHSPPTGR